MERWREKVAIVTGASGGIGAAIAEKLAQEGIKVVGVARRIEPIESLAKKYSNKQINAFKADLTKTEDIKAAFKWTLENLGPVHILVNNAGIMPKTPVLGGDIETWRKTFETNVLATAIASDIAYKIMKDHGIDGHIVNINSIIGHEHLYMPNLGLYGPSKFAVTSYTEQLRKELTHFNSKIKTTSVSPGFVESGLLVDYTAEEQKMFDSLPSLKAADVADALAYVLSTPPNVQITELTIRPVGDKF